MLKRSPLLLLTPRDNIDADRDGIIINTIIFRLDFKTMRNKKRSFQSASTKFYIGTLSPFIRCKQEKK